MNQKKIFIAGGAGFIGSHYIDYLLAFNDIEKVTIFDNLSSGTKKHFQQHIDDRRFAFIHADIHDSKRLLEAMADHHLVIHLASNPDIAKAISQPDIDFVQGTALTNAILEAMRVLNIKKIIYASGSGVYGDIGTTEASENYSPMIVNSTYGASKLASEAMIAAYSNMFDIQGLCFRFGNVVGSRQTHGVAFDFIHKLNSNPLCLNILGNGKQSKPYIHVKDVIDATMLALKEVDTNFECFNIATKDHLSVIEIANMVCQQIGATNVNYRYSGGDRGWKGDVPIVRLNTNKIRALGWENRYNSRQAMQMAIDAMLTELT